MFSGLVRTLGKVSINTPPRLEVVAKGVKTTLGDSVAINGVCLTVIRTRMGGGWNHMLFELSPETYTKTTLRGIKKGAMVNVEPALTLKDALGGHIVQGHVDDIGSVRKVLPQGQNRTIWFNVPADLRRYIVMKGSITVDGVSLTVAKKDKMGFAVALIPYTLLNTQLQFLKKGQKVNIETDVFAKYVAAYLKK